MKKLFPRVSFDKKLSKRQKMIITFLFGGIGYGLIEVIWRERTHISMVITGGACFLLMRIINARFFKKSVLLRSLMCAFMITSIEFAVGCVVNKWLRLGVWDYSALRFNLWGQISLTYSFLWFLLCIPALLLLSRADGKVKKA